MFDDMTLGPWHVSHLRSMEMYILQNEVKQQLHFYYQSTRNAIVLCSLTTSDRTEHHLKLTINRDKNLE